MSHSFSFPLLQAGQARMICQRIEQKGTKSSRSRDWGGERKKSNLSFLVKRNRKWFSARATTSCKNVKTLPRKTDLSYFKSLLVTRLWDIHSPPSSPPFRVVPPSFEHGLVLLATLIRGGEGITSTRSWTGHLSQNMVQCLKYFATVCSYGM